MADCDMTRRQSHGKSRRSLRSRLPLLNKQSQQHSIGWRLWFRQWARRPSQLVLEDSDYNNGKDQSARDRISSCIKNSFIPAESGDHASDLAFDCRFVCRHKSAPDLSSIENSMMKSSVFDRTVNSSDDSASSMESPVGIIGSSPRIFSPSHCSLDTSIRIIIRECDISTSNATIILEILEKQFGTADMDMIALEKHLGCQLVPFIGMLIFDRHGLCETLVERKSLLRLLQVIHPRYMPENPFHNACHAADVMHGLYVMIKTTELSVRISRHNQLGVLLAAIMHDIEHVGLTNDFLKKSNHKIASEYPGISPMEAMHAVIAESLMLNPETNVVSRFEMHEQSEILKVVKETILSTALCTQRSLLEDVQLLCESTECSLPILPFHVQLPILRLVIHVSDIGHTMKPFEIHEKWAHRLKEENFLEGDKHKQLAIQTTPAYCDRTKFSTNGFIQSQINFLETFVAPAVTALNKVPWLDVSNLVGGLNANLISWKQQLEQQ